MPETEPATDQRVSFVVQSRVRDGLWEDHYNFPGALDSQRDRATQMADVMDEDYRGPWRVVRRLITDEEVATFDSRALAPGACS